MPSHARAVQLDLFGAEVDLRSIQIERLSPEALPELAPETGPAHSVKIGVVGLADRPSPSAVLQRCHFHLMKHLRERPELDNVPFHFAGCLTIGKPKPNPCVFDQTDNFPDGATESAELADQAADHLSSSYDLLVVLGVGDLAEKGLTVERLRRTNDIMTTLSKIEQRGTRVWPTCANLTWPYAKTQYMGWLAAAGTTTLPTISVEPPVGGEAEIRAWAG